MSAGRVQRILLFVLLCFVIGASTSSAAVEVTFKQIDANNFPFIFSTVTVSIDGQPNDGLDETNFTATEDGRLQTDYFQVIPPSESGGSRLADVVFLIDNSGSMGSEIAAVRNNVNAFAEAMAAAGIDYRLGAVKFGNGSGANPYVYGGGNLTADLGTFHSWINSMNASGSWEPGLQAIIDAVNSFNFRPGSVRHFLIITDEDSDGGSLSTAISLCLVNNIVVHAAANCGSGSSYAHYCAPNTSISGATGGHVFPVVGPYDQILTDILNEISDTYIVRYKTDNPVFDGLQREVVIGVTFNSESGNDVGYYTPGAGPSIQRTSETILMTATPQVEGGALTFTASIIDNVAPGVQSASLFYRTTGMIGYSVLPMSNSGGDLYTVSLPGASVQHPGLEYYLTATDGQLSASDPTVDPGLYPYSIAVLPNIAPQINHTPIADGVFETPIDIECEVIDGTNLVDVVQLHYRKIGQLIYQITDMTNTSGNNYSAVIPPDFVTYDGVQYKIKAYDDLGVYSTHGPHDVEVPLDSDGDGLLDTWEINGYTADGVFIDLAAMGCDPLRKDILVEIDWMGQDCPAGVCHDHEPTARALDAIRDAFADMPIGNPKGINGINIILDAGAHGGGNEINHEHNLNLGLLWPMLGGDFSDIKNANFDSKREKIFHYCVIAHSINNDSRIGGISRGIPGNDFIISVGSSFTDNDVAAVFIHELGHNLNLRHGGNNNTNRKPNYLSVMNYNLAYSGVNRNGRSSFTYSNWHLPDLNEDHLDETVGLHAGSFYDNWRSEYLCNDGADNPAILNINSAIDWNCDGDMTDTDVKANINFDHWDIWELVQKYNTLESHDDFSTILFDGGDIGTRTNKAPADTTGLVCMTWDDMYGQVPWSVSGFNVGPGFGVVNFNWIPLWEHIDSSLYYELELTAIGSDTRTITVMDSVYSDSSFESATEYQMCIRSKTGYDVYSEVSDTAYHSTYAFDRRDAYLGQRSATVDVIQGRDVVLKFRLNNLDGSLQDDARYCYTLRRYHDPELKLPVAIEAEILSITSDLLESATFDESTGLYRLALGTTRMNPGRWGGKILLDDGTGHWFGFNVIEDDTPPEESTEEETKEQ